MKARLCLLIVLATLLVACSQAIPETEPTAAETATATPTRTAAPTRTRANTPTPEPSTKVNMAFAAITEAPPSPPAATEPPPPPPPPAGSCDCTSGDTLNCPAFGTQAAAQACHDHCVATVGYDVHGLDGNDNDGLACESLP